MSTQRQRAAVENPLVRFQRGFEAALHALRAGYHELLALAIEHRRLFVGGFLGFIAVSFLLAPFLGRNFFPQVDGGQILLHVRAPVGMRIEETAARFTEVEKAIREVIPPAEVGAWWTTSARIFRRSIPSTTTPARSASRTATSRSRSTRDTRRPPLRQSPAR
jgi:multidrug efflux pump subunit AcrB